MPSVLERCSAGFRTCMHYIFFFFLNHNNLGSSSSSAIACYMRRFSPLPWSHDWEILDFLIVELSRFFVLQSSVLPVSLNETVSLFNWRTVRHSFCVKIAILKKIIIIKQVSILFLSPFNFFAYFFFYEKKTDSRVIYPLRHYLQGSNFNFKVRTISRIHIRTKTCARQAKVRHA